MSAISIPNPILTGPFQPGITDPQWPVEIPEIFADNKEASENYLLERAGRIDPQNFFTAVTADVAVTNKDELRDLFKSITSFAIAQMNREPNNNHIPVLKEIPKSYRVTVTIGLGASLFITDDGDDRFGLRHNKPKWLKTMPKVTGDKFEPAGAATDLIFIIASDHPYVNVSIARALCQGNWGEQGVKEARLKVRTVDQGFMRPDRREFLRFDDGIDNLSNLRDRELDKFVYVAPQDAEPAWAVNGAYLVWRKIKENLSIWEAFATAHQEGMIGRKKDTGKPLSRHTEGIQGMTPVYPKADDKKDGPITAHIRKMQPRRPGVDLMGVPDLDRRFLRRGYPFFDGLESNGEVQCGLLFMAFMRDLRKQFEWPVENWQTNPDFPKAGAGIDVMYGSGVFSNISGGYYFCPPAADYTNGGFIGMDMFI